MRSQVFGFSDIDEAVTIPYGNYTNHKELVEAFGAAVKAVLLAHRTGDDAPPSHLGLTRISVVDLITISSSSEGKLCRFSLFLLVARLFELAVSCSR